MSKRTVAANLIFLSLATPCSAQDWAVAQHPDDQYILSSDAAPASNWNGQPWYAPLAECGEVFKLEPLDHRSSEVFTGTAAYRIATDRKIEFEDAYYIVLPAFEVSYRKRAKTMVDAFGTEKVQMQCNALYNQYKLADEQLK